MENKNQRDEDFYKGYEEWKKIEGNRWKGIGEYAHQKLVAEGRVTVLTMEEVFPHWDKGEVVLKGNMRLNNEGVYLPLFNKY